MAKIALIDDDPGLLETLQIAFSSAGHEVVTAGDGQTGLSRILAEGVELVVCDVNMPALDGFTLCRRLRETPSSVPVILLTARDNEIDEALGLELGADDYVAKPFSTRVLLARVTALLRRQRSRSNEKSEPPLAAGKLELFPERLEVRFAGAPVEVTLTEFRLLETLVRRPGIVFSRERLLSLVRGDDSVVAERIIDTYVRRLRRKLEHVDAGFAGIETVVGAGYRFRIES